MTGIAMVAVLACAGSPRAEAGDFFSALFGGLFRERPAPSPSLPFASEFDGLNAGAEPAPERYSGRAMAYCVRTCDGRYFPLQQSSGQSRAATCQSLCPASETRVYVGSSIDNASASESGQSYGSLPNAFRYRTELVGGCTCNGKSAGGLAAIRLEDDPTLRKGDLVANADGALVASRGNEPRSFSSNTSRQGWSRLGAPVVAAQ